MEAMIESVRMLLARAIDYAGLFPPARLSMPAATAEFTALRRGDDGWMVARFVCPASRLGELTAALAENAPAGPLLVAALATGGTSAAELVAALREDVAAIAAFTSATGRGGRIDQLELKLPPDVVAAADADAIAALLLEVDAMAASALRGPALVAAETPLPGRPGREVEAAAEGVARAVARLDPGAGRSIALKARLGGLDASAFPSAAEVAAALAAARDRAILLKVTQGLHGPLPHHDGALGVAAHGFLNVLIAGVLARCARLDGAALAELLEAKEPGAFRFNEDGLAWRSHPASLAEIATGRREGVATFGSCSIEEPRNGLRALGLLP
jgi:hypothetical protein